MSAKNPECPLYNPLNCKEYYNPKLCLRQKEQNLPQKNRQNQIKIHIPQKITNKTQMS